MTLATLVTLHRNVLKWLVSKFDKISFSIKLSKCHNEIVKTIPDFMYRHLYFESTKLEFLGCV